MEQVHATIIMILLLRDLQNQKAKNRVRKNCWFSLFKKPCNKRESHLCNNVLHLLSCWLHLMWVMQACRSFANPNLPQTCSKYGVQLVYDHPLRNLGVKWRAPKSRSETHLRVPQSQVAESWDLEARSRLPTLERGRGSSWEPWD
jgi:hypothetical protein